MAQTENIISKIDVNEIMRRININEVSRKFCKFPRTYIKTSTKRYKNKQTLRRCKSLIKRNFFCVSVTLFSCTQRVYLTAKEKSRVFAIRTILCLKAQKTF